MQSPPKVLKKITESRNIELQKENIYIKSKQITDNLQNESFQIKKMSIQETRTKKKSIFTHLGEIEELQAESKKIIEQGIQTSVRKDYKQLLSNVIITSESRQRNDPLILLLSMIILLFSLIVFVFIWSQSQANGTFYQ